MSRYVETWEVGDMIKWKGPFGEFTYKANKVLSCRNDGDDDCCDIDSSGNYCLEMVMMMMMVMMIMMMKMMMIVMMMIMSELAIIKIRSFGIFVTLY